MDATTTPVTELSESQSWQLLSGLTLGRLVTTVGGWTEIFPVNFVVQNRTLLFRTAEGTKLLTAVLNENVVFEADDHNVVEGWSVVVRGTAKLLSTAAEIAEARIAGAGPPAMSTESSTIAISATEMRPLKMNEASFLVANWSKVCVDCA